MTEEEAAAKEAWERILWRVNMQKRAEEEDREPEEEAEDGTHLVHERALVLPEGLGSIPGSRRSRAPSGEVEARALPREAEVGGQQPVVGAEMTDARVKEEA